MADRTFIEWDKDDIDALGMMKVDVLALGMLTCIRKAFDLMRAHLRHGATTSPTVPGRGSGGLRHAVQGRLDRRVPGREPGADDHAAAPASRAKFYDLVIEVAIVRPGPDPGRHGASLSARGAAARSRSSSLAVPEHGPPTSSTQVLGKTLGVPLFQEQAMKLAIVAAELHRRRGQRLRRAMATFRNVGTIHQFEEKMVERHGGARL